MNKAEVEKLIPKAYDALITAEIARNNTIDGNYRSQISTFGAAVSMGSLLAAVAYFGKSGDASLVDRSKLLHAIELTLGCEKPLFEVVRDAGNPASVKEQVLDAAIALKLAMNLFVQK